MCRNDTEPTDHLWGVGVKQTKNTHGLLLKKKKKVKQNKKLLYERKVSVTE